MIPVDPTDPTNCGKTSEECCGETPCTETAKEEAPVEAADTANGECKNCDASPGESTEEPASAA